MTQQEFQQRYTYNPVTDKLGEGGFGKVFKTYDTYLDKWVAMKISPVGDHDSIRLRKEVEMVAKLPAHPNIARYEECYTFSSFDGEYDFGILQYYAEGNLSQLLKNNTLTLLQKQSLLSQILEGISFLHQNGIIHRDLKPQNILIVKRGKEYIPKITDFGISKQLDINKSSVFNNSLAGAGTLSYASPEQLREDVIRKNTDLWSFGIIVYQVFTGNLPFNTGNHVSTSEEGRQELFKQIKSGELPADIKTLPERWQKIVRRCLVTSPQNRAQNEQELRHILNAGTEEIKTVVEGKSSEKRGADPVIIVQHPGSTTYPPVVTGKPVETDKSPGNKKYALAIIVAAVLILAIVLFMLKGDSSSSEVTNVTINRPDGVSFVYSGSLLKGMPVGIGTAFYLADSSTYEGAFINGYREGKGKTTYPDKIVYEGYYEKDKAEGQGEMRYPDGSRYKGAWQNNVQNGYGVYYTPSNDSIKGRWVNGEAPKQQR